MPYKLDSSLFQYGTTLYTYLTLLGIKSTDEKDIDTPQKKGDTLTTTSTPSPSFICPYDISEDLYIEWYNNQDIQPISKWSAPLKGTYAILIKTTVHLSLALLGSVADFFSLLIMKTDHSSYLLKNIKAYGRDFQEGWGYWKVLGNEGRGRFLIEKSGFFKTYPNFPKDPFSTTPTKKTPRNEHLYFSLFQLIQDPDKTKFLLELLPNIQKICNDAKIDFLEHCNQTILQQLSFEDIKYHPLKVQAMLTPPQQLSTLLKFIFNDEHSEAINTNIINALISNLTMNPGAIDNILTSAPLGFQQLINFILKKMSTIKQAYNQYPQYIQFLGTFTSDQIWFVFKHFPKKTFHFVQYFSLQQLINLDLTNLEEIFEVTTAKSDEIKKDRKMLCQKFINEWWTKMIISSSLIYETPPENVILNIQNALKYFPPSLVKSIPISIIKKLNLHTILSDSNKEEYVEKLDSLTKSQIEALDLSNLSDQELITLLFTPKGKKRTLIDKLSEKQLQEISSKQPNLQEYIDTNILVTSTK